MPNRSALVLGSLALGGLALSASVVVAVVPSTAGKGSPDTAAGLSSASGGAHQQEMPTFGAGAHRPGIDHGSWERLFRDWGR